VSKVTRWLETFVVDSWGEHERQHGRTTSADRRSSARIAALLEPGTSPTIGHFIAAPDPPRDVRARAFRDDDSHDANQAGKQGQR